jgi:hypothetical protein
LPTTIAPAAPKARHHGRISVGSVDKDRAGGSGGWSHHVDIALHLKGDAPKRQIARAGHHSPGRLAQSFVRGRADEHRPVRQRVAAADHVFYLVKQSHPGNKGGLQGRKA